MIRILYISLLLLVPFHLMASSYSVNLAIYKNKKSLNKALAKLPSELRKTIVFTSVKGKYMVQSLFTKDKTLLTALLPTYKKIFPKASISQIVLKISPTKKHKELDNFNTLIQNKTFYLCSQSEDKNKKFLLEVAFGKKTANYVPILGKVPPMTALYKVNDNKLFLYQKKLLNTNIYSLLEKTTPTYFLISSWVDGKKIQTLRYYFNINDAKTYLGLNKIGDF